MDSEDMDAPQAAVRGQLRPRRQVILAAPRGFCAGVERAIHIVEAALQKFGAPVYVRHEIVHNAHVVNGLREKGAVFVDELDEIPDNDRPVIFSAHGVPKSVPEEAQRRRLFYIDATCPLVSKVHNEVIRSHRNGRHIFLVGHKGHPEVVGSLGQVPAGAVTLIETVEDAQRVIPPQNQALSFVTQTTLSVDDTALIIDVLKARFPGIISPAKEDICYATTNRQNAVKAVAAEADLVLVVGAANSSNSLRLVESARRAGCPHSILIRNADDIPWQEVENARTIGISAGASAPEDLVEQVLQSLGTRYRLDIQSFNLIKEDVVFKIPALLAETSEQSNLYDH